MHSWAQNLAQRAVRRFTRVSSPTATDPHEHTALRTPERPTTSGTQGAARNVAFLPTLPGSHMSNLGWYGVEGFDPACTNDVEIRLFAGAVDFVAVLLHAPFSKEHMENMQGGRVEGVENCELRLSRALVRSAF